MPEVFIATHAAASAESRKSTLPPVPCAPWCRDGAGHTDARHPEDQWCSTDPEGVELDAAPLATNLSHNGLPAIVLTPAEAVAMGQILTRLGRQAQA